MVGVELSLDVQVVVAEEDAVLQRGQGAEAVPEDLASSTCSGQSWPSLPSNQKSKQKMATFSTFR